MTDTIDPTATPAAATLNPGEMLYRVSTRDKLPRLIAYRVTIATVGTVYLVSSEGEDIAMSPAECARSMHRSTLAAIEAFRIRMRAEAADAEARAKIARRLAASI